MPAFGMPAFGMPAFGIPGMPAFGGIPGICMLGICMLGICPSIPVAPIIPGTIPGMPGRKPGCIGGMACVIGGGINGATVKVPLSTASFESHSCINQLNPNRSMKQSMRRSIVQHL